MYAVHLERIIILLWLQLPRLGSALVRLIMAIGVTTFHISVE
jgi:hypothetical protein